MPSNGSHVNRRRRKVIKSVGAAGVVGLAGCSGGGDSGESAETTTGGDGGTATTTGTPTATPPEADTVLTFWTLFGGGDGVVMRSMIDKFNEERPLGDSVGIRRQRIPWDQYYDKLYTSMTGGAAPDMAIMHGSYLRTYGDVLTPFNDLIDFSMEDEYLASHTNLVTIGDSINGLPLDFHPVGTYYNKSIFEEAGLDPESPPSNWEEFKKAGDTIAKETDYDVYAPTPYMDGVGSFRAWSGYVKQAGGEIFNDSWEPVFDNEAGQQMTELFYNMTGDMGWTKQSSSENWANQRFQNGNLAMTTNGTWYVNVMRELDDFKWGMFKPFVAPGRQQKVAWADGHTIVLPRNKKRSDKKTKLAAKAAHWITTENPEWGKEAGHLPSAKSIHDSGALKEADFYDKTLKKFLEMARKEQYYFHPQTPTGNPYNENWWNWLVDVWAHNSEPKEGIKSGIQTISSALK